MAQPSIIVYRGFQGSGAYAWSPFVTKLEARLRFGGLTYRTEPGSVPRAPRGKIPYIAISNAESGSQPPTIVSDSSLISQKLVDDGLMSDLNAKLSLAEKAHDMALRALFEDRLYFYQNYERWIENYYTMRPGVLWMMPYPVQLVVGLLAYRKMTQTLYGQGTMRYSTEEISSFRKQIWENLNALLVESRNKSKKTGDGSEAFWVRGGAEPSEADSTVFGFIASALVCTAAPETGQVVRSFPVVVEYARRIHDRYFPDYTLWE
ncbi:hypothetical protein MMC17_006103 [Xylographa soralifera]|nr:hypothetical protein [Xylographa soralifera]